MSEFVLLFNILYYPALISAGIQGAAKAGSDATRIRMILSIILSAFGGGLTRDLVLGHTPVLIMPSTLPEVLLVIAAAWIYLCIARRVPRLRSAWDRAAFIADAVGIGSFTIIGYSHALGLPLPVQFFSAISTTIGGGMIASLLNHRQINFNRYYGGISGGILFYLLLKAISPFLADAVMMLTLFLVTLVCNEKGSRTVSRALSGFFVPQERVCSLIYCPICTEVKFRRFHYTAKQDTTGFANQRIFVHCHRFRFC